MVNTSDIVYKYYEVGFAVKHKKDGIKAGFVEVSIGYTRSNPVIDLIYKKCCKVAAFLYMVCLTGFEPATVRIGI